MAIRLFSAQGECMKVISLILIGAFMTGEIAVATDSDTNFIQSISQMVIYPKDISASKDFYLNTLGFKLDYEFGGGPVKGYQLSLNGAAITLLQVDGAPNTEIKKFMIHFSVKNVDTFYAQIQAKNIKIALPIENTDWGTRWFQIEDPNGLTIALEEKLSK